MNSKDYFTYLFIIPGIIFSLLLLFLGSSFSIWLFLGISFGIGLILLLAENRASIKNLLSARIAAKPTQPSAQAPALPLKTKIRPTAKKALVVIVGIAVIAVILLAFQHFFPDTARFIAVTLPEMKNTLLHNRGPDFYGGDCYPAENSADTYVVNSGGTCHLSRKVSGIYPWVALDLSGKGNVTASITTPDEPQGKCNFVSNKVAFNGTNVEYEAEIISGFKEVTVKERNRVLYQDKRLASDACLDIRERLINATIAVDPGKQNALVKFEASVRN